MLQSKSSCLSGACDFSRRNVRRRIFVTAACLGLFAAADVARAVPPADAAKRIDFKTEVAPILQQNCVDCHGPNLRMAGLRLDQRKFARVEGKSEGLITPGKSADSLLIQRMTDKELGLIMPPSFPFFPGEKPGLSEKQIRILKQWIDEGADWPEGIELATDAKSSSEDAGARTLFAAIRAGDKKVVAALLADRSLAKKTDSYGSTPLMHAALYSDADAMGLLLAAGADVNVANSDGMTALMWAVGNLDKTRLLIDKGAKVDVRTELGRTPLLIASTYAGNVDVVRLLLQQGAKVADIDQFGETPLTSAAKRGDAQVVEALIKAGADLQAGGRAPLVWAAEEGNVETVACLLRNGAGKNQVHLNQALFSAAVRGPVAAVQLLLERGGDPSARAGFAGYTPLMGAAYSELNSAEMVKLLLDKGADVKIQGANGETALSLAKKRGRTAVVELLEKAGAAE